MMEHIEWANGKGLTLRLTQEEIEELCSLLLGFVRAYQVTGESPHFSIERETV